MRGKRLLFCIRWAGTTSLRERALQTGQQAQAPERECVGLAPGTARRLDFLELSGCCREPQKRGQGTADEGAGPLGFTPSGMRRDGSRCTGQLKGLDLGVTCDQSGCCFGNRLKGTKLVTC